jgi:hypothetical protein
VLRPQVVVDDLLAHGGKVDLPQIDQAHLAVVHREHGRSSCYTSAMPRYIRIRRIAQSEEQTSTDVSLLTPGERMSMMWQLALQAWMFKEGLTDEPRLRRDVVRTLRGGR